MTEVLVAPRALEDGTALDATLFRFDPSRIVLGAPGAPGCP